MASLIACPHCGLRPREEFLVRGAHPGPRPDPEAGAQAWHEWLHLPANPKGVTRELWRHSAGCRRWLVVERDVVSHQVHAVTDAAEGSAEGVR